MAGRSDVEMRHYLTRWSRWRVPGPGWTAALEYQLYSDMLRQGVHAFQSPAYAQFQISIPAIADRLAQLSGDPEPRRGWDFSPETIEFPIEISPHSKIHALGRIEWERPAFHNDRYIYPIGFLSSRLSASLDRRSQKARWFSEIIDGGDAPIFRVWMEGREDSVFEGASPTAPWTQVLRAVAVARQNPSKSASVSGPEAFLLASPLVLQLIQGLPDAEKCTRYIFKDIPDLSVLPVFTPSPARGGTLTDDVVATEAEPIDQPESPRRRRR
jgi:hypothetical protein